MRIFACDWISNNANEREYLFCGGKYTMEIEGVKLTKTKTNYHKHFKCLYYFDCMLNGGKMRKKVVDIDRNDLRMMQQLIEHRLRKPVYIYQSFDAFVWNKCDIRIDLESTERYFGIFSQLILSNKSFKIQIIEIFQNLQNINIIARDSSNRIDLLPLCISLIESTIFKQNRMTMKLKAIQCNVNEIQQGKSWISDEYYKLTNTQISSLLNIQLRKGKVRTKSGLETWDVCVIRAIKDVWKCPICYYGQSKETQECSMCGYSTQSTAGGSQIAKHEEMQQIWFANDDEYFLHNDPLYEWEMHNQQEIEGDINNSDGLITFGRNKSLGGVENLHTMRSIVVNVIDEDEKHNDGVRQPSHILPANEIDIDQDEDKLLGMVDDMM